MKKNLEQVRAQNALATFNPANRTRFRGKADGKIISGLPNHLINHGLLAMIAYGYSDKGHQFIFDAVAKHLADERIGIAPRNCETMEDLARFLTSEGATSDSLKRATAETMRFLQYAKRFSGESGNREDEAQ